MAQLDYFIFAENVVVGRSIAENYEIKKPKKVFTIPNTPNTYSFFACISIFDFDFTEKHTVQVMLKSEAGQLIGEKKDFYIPIKANNVSSSLPDEFVAYVISVDYRNTYIENEGKYKCEVYFDNEFIGSKYLYFLKVRRD